MESIVKKIIVNFALFGCLLITFSASPSFGSSASQAKGKTCLTATLGVAQGTVRQGYGSKAFNFVPLELKSPSLNCALDARRVQLRVVQTEPNSLVTKWSSPVSLNRLVDKARVIYLKFNGKEGCKSRGSKVNLEARFVGSHKGKFTYPLVISGSAKLCSPISLVVDDSQVLVRN